MNCPLRSLRGTLVVTGAEAGGWDENAVVRECPLLLESPWPCANLVGLGAQGVGRFMPQEVTFRCSIDVGGRAVAA